jgi:hypothetical protein
MERRKETPKYSILTNKSIYSNVKLANSNAYAMLQIETENIRAENHFTTPPIR